MSYTEKYAEKYGALIRQLNGPWHEVGLKAYMFVVLSHWAEHLVQAVQIFYLHWPRAQSLGLLGQFYPWLVTSELMHYLYALVMLIGLWIFRSGFTGVSRTWWNIALVIQFWHHFEHLLLQGQAIFSYNLFNSPVPISILQLWIPRAELHLFYNSVVFVPMIIGMYYHMFPSENEPAANCTCAWHLKPSVA